MSWSALYNWRSAYLFRHILERDRELGLDVATTGSTEDSGGVSWLTTWYGMQQCSLGLLDWGPPAFRDKGFQDKAKEYAKTHDKKNLVREPCLNDPAYREIVRKAALETAERAYRLGGAFDFCMGDEMSLTSYTAYHDYCFGPHCLAKFREWLKEKYGSLDALNAEWETKFADWKDVTPMTAAETQGRKNCAPWADHRTFMEDTLADFYSMIAAALRTVDPEAKVGLSGTQAPEAGNGQDWWKLCRAFNYYHSYNTEYSEEMRRSFKQSTGVMSSPYYAGYWGAGRRLEHNLWYCLLHDCQSISSWTTNLFFYPDLTFSESGRDTRDGMNELKAGIWDAVRAGRR